MFDFLSKTAKLALDVATAPVAVAADVITMGGALTDKDEPYTVTKVKKIYDDVEDLADINGDNK